MTRKAATLPTPDPDATFFSRLRERLTFLGNRRWLQLSALALLLALGVWGFFYVRSLLPRTPAQILEAQTETLHTALRVREATAKLELLRAMIEARREAASLERYRSLIATDLEEAFKRSPEEVNTQWDDVERLFNQLQADINEGGERTLTTLDDLKVSLQGLEF
jgi:hypothetical protein